MVTPHITPVVESIVLTYWITLFLVCDDESTWQITSIMLPLGPVCGFLDWVLFGGSLLEWLVSMTVMMVLAAGVAAILCSLVKKLPSKNSE